MKDYNTLVKEAIEKAYAEAQAKAEAEKKAQEETIVRFEVGKTYATNSACDHNCWFTYTIIKRTAKTVIIEDRFGKQKRCKIQVGGYFKNETIYPQGVYSMCPILRADRDEIEVA